MSNEALTWAFKQAELKSGPRFTLVVLADYADEERSCFPGIPKIAERTGASAAAVRAHIQVLIAGGWVSIERRHRDNGSRTSNRYTLILDRVAPESDAGDLAPESGQSKRQNLGSLAPESGGVNRNPQENPQSEPSEETPVVPSELVAADPDWFELAWKSWPRKEDKKLARERFQRLAKRSGMGAQQMSLQVARFGTAYSAWPKDQQEFVPYLATWLSRERWNDPDPEPRTGNLDRSVMQTGRDLYMEAIRREQERNNTTAERKSIEQP